MSLLLSSLLSPSKFNSNNNDLIIITDSILTPGISLLREFISSTLLRQENVILIALEQGPSKLLPLRYEQTQVEIIDCISLPFASTSNLASTRSDLIDIYSFDGITELEREVLAAIARVKSDAKVLVVVDSSTCLAERGVHVVFMLLKKIIDSIKGNPGSRLLTLHHHLFPLVPTPILSSIQADLLLTLLSPSLSTSTIHLTLHPSSLLELFSRDYGLSIPLAVNAPLDLRLNPFLTSFNARSFGNPLVRPKKSTEEDERIVMDIGGKIDGGNVVEWSCRGVSWSQGGLKRGEVKKFLSRGLEGMRRTREGVEAVGLNKVLRWESMIAVSSQDVIATPSNSVKPVEPALPFNLSLTESQKLAREEVVLPYLPKEGGVDYVPDAGDDMDNDDPDEDLEI